MAAERVADMNVDELKTLINEALDRRLQEILKPRDTRSVEEILASIDRHMYTPPPGTPSTLELLREDRDR
jgi:hypothetical protein